MGHWTSEGQEIERPSAGGRQLGQIGTEVYHSLTVCLPLLAGHVHVLVGELVERAPHRGRRGQNVLGGPRRGGQRA